MAKSMMKEPFEALPYTTLMASTLDIKHQLITFVHQGVYLNMVSLLLEESLLLTSRSPNTTATSHKNNLHPFEVPTPSN